MTGPLTIAEVNAIARRKLDAKARANASSFLAALDRYGDRLGLDQPHRLVQLLCQVMHENGEFRFDREVWGPTPAQARYDTRTNLGNTAAKDGDGKLYMGRTGIQITGKSNYRQFTAWCRKLDPSAPDFVKSPDLVNTDPWEGLGPLWYWDTRGLNRLADQGDVENITERVNGGLNGYADRVTILARASLVLLGYGPDEVKRFQSDHKMALIDGKPGPKTRALMHVALVNLTKGAMSKPTVTAAPVTEKIVEKRPVAVAPEQIDRPVTQTTGFWERITTIGGLLGTGTASFLGDWRVVAALVVGTIVIVLLGLMMHARIVAAVKSIKQEIAS